MAFKFKKKRKKHADLPAPLRPYKPSTDPLLTGVVNQKRASDLEEYFALALRQLGIGFYFQYIIDTPYTIPGQSKNVDFLVYYGKRAYPIEIYGAYFHTSAGDLLKDQDRERILNDEFRKRGFEDLTVVWEWEVFDLETALSTVRRLFLI